MKHSGRWMANRAWLTLLLLVTLLLPAIGSASPVLAASSGQIEIENLDGVPYDDRLVFQRINSGSFQTHRTANLRIKNTGTTPLSIQNLSISGGDSASFTVASAGFQVAPGAFHDVEVNFVAGSNGNVKGLRQSTLVIQSSDADTPTLPVELAGFNMIDNGGNNEPSFQQILDTFGYRTNILNPGEKQGLTPPRDALGSIVPGNFAVGDEVISAKWTRADTSKSVYVRQLAALSGGGSVTSIRVGGNSVGHGLYQFQTFLPLSDSTANPGSPAEMTVNPTGAFSVGVGGYSSDRSNPSPGVRFWAARDRSGVLIPNTYIIGQDYVETNQTNYDYQDNVYLITNVRPTTGVDPNKPAPQPGAPSLVLEFDKNTYPGTLTDKDGETTGFPETQRNKQDIVTPQNAPSTSYSPDLLNLNTGGQGTLAIRTSVGSNAGTDNSLVNGLCTPFDGRNGKFIVSTRLIGPLDAFTKAYQQGGVMFGPNQGNFLKLTAGVQVDGTDPGKPWIQWTQEISNTASQVGPLISITSPQTVATLDLQMTADAATGTVEAAYRINGGILVKLPDTVTLSGTTRARFFDLQTKGCILALHKNASEISVVFDRFAVTPAVPEVGLPTVNAGPDQKVPINTQVTLNGTATDASGAVLTGSWEQVSGTPQVVLSGSGNTRTFTAPSSYKVLTFAFVATDSQGRSASDTVTIVVGDQPITKLTINATTPVELGTATRISANMQGGSAPISYEWNFGDGTPPVNGGPVIKHVYAALGDYTVTLTARNAAGAATAQTNVTVQPVVPPFAFRYNVGGPTVTTPDGLTWKTDDGPPKIYTPDAPREKRPTTPAIANTDNDVIYQDYRGKVTVDPKTITFEIPINSQTTPPVPETARVIANVRLHFAELYWGAPGGGAGGVGSRIFNVAIEGSAVLNQFDIFNAAGAANTAVIKEFNGIVVNDGKLTISLQAVKDYAALSAIEVISAPKPTPENKAPTADAGQDQVVTVGTPVTLTGSGSDPDGDALAYSWQQTGGPTVALGGSSAAVRTFTPTAPGSYIFNLTTTDTGGLSGSDTVVITVNDTTLPPNNPPTADAGQDQTAIMGIPITLTGSGSDPDGDTLTYRWAQTAGPAVTLGGGEGDAIRTFTPTSVGSYIFTFTTTDARGLSGADSVVITVVDAPPAGNEAPTANAGVDQTVGFGEATVLDGTGSSDAEGGALTYRWQQTGGPAVTLSSNATARPTFVAPGSPTTLTFQLVVTDNFGVTSAINEVQIQVINKPVEVPDSLRLFLPLVIAANT